MSNDSLLFSLAFFLTPCSLLCIAEVIISTFQDQMGEYGQRAYYSGLQVGSKHNACVLPPQPPILQLSIATRMPPFSEGQFQPQFLSGRLPAHYNLEALSRLWEEAGVTRCLS